MCDQKSTLPYPPLLGLLCAAYPVALDGPGGDAHAGAAWGIVDLFEVGGFDQAVDFFYGAAEQLGDGDRGE